jgi:hypothetical protein
MGYYAGAGTGGLTGAPGKSIQSGRGSPLPEFGNDGDFYIDTETSRLYGPKMNGVWTTSVSLIGSGSIDHREEVPTGPINGVNPVFVLSAVPVPNSLSVSLRGLIRRRTVDYSLTNMEIAFNVGSVPQIGDVLFVSYNT